MNLEKIPDWSPLYPSTVPTSTKEVTVSGQNFPHPRCPCVAQVSWTPRLLVRADKASSNEIKGGTEGDQLTQCLNPRGIPESPRLNAEWSFMFVVHGFHS